MNDMEEKTQTADGNIHVMPSGEDHQESENCWCTPRWDSENKLEYQSGLAAHKVFVHRNLGECSQ